jgi:hypothetical protein
MVLVMIIVGSIGAALARLQPSCAYTLQATEPKDRIMSTEQQPFFVRPG